MNHLPCVVKEQSYLLLKGARHTQIHAWNVATRVCAGSPTKRSYYNNFQSYNVATFGQYSKHACSPVFESVGAGDHVGEVEGVGDGLHNRGGVSLAVPVRAQHPPFGGPRGAVRGPHHHPVHHQAGLLLVVVEKLLQSDTLPAASHKAVDT